MKSVFLILVILLALPSEAADITVRQGDSIQSAVDRARPGDTIIVYNGTYLESINIIKPLTLRGVENPLVESPIYGDHAINISADGSRVEGFYTKAHGFGSAGINIVSSDNIVRGNIIEGSYDYGIKVEGSRYNNISRNTVTSEKSLLRGNGIYLYKSTENIVAENILDSNDNGIYLLDCNGGNILRGNLAKNSRSDGISMQNSGRNRIYENYFLDNERNAWDDRKSNEWDYGQKGNYYSNHDCHDDSIDGICLSSYAIAGGSNVDRYPLASWRMPARYDPGSEISKDGVADESEGAIVSATTPASSQANIIRHELLSQVVNPNDHPQTISYQDKLKVIIPGGLLDEPKTLTISRADGLPGLDNPFLLASERYDISLEGMKSFDKDITIQMPLDIQRLDDELSPQDQIIIASWNETKGIWEKMLFEVNEESISVYTKHLSIWTALYVCEGFKPLFLTKNSASGSCKVRFWHLPQDYQDAREVEDFFNASWNRYDSKGFRMPAGTMDIFITFAEKSPNYQLLDIDNTIYFYIRQNSKIYCDIAHELFHVVENQYMYSVSMVSYREWWMDTVASYAESKVAWPRDDTAWNYVRGRTRQNYLEDPLNLNADPHRYANAIFIDFLVSKGADFKKMWEYTSSPSWGDTMDALDPLDKYLKATFGITNGLAYQYRDFAEYYLFDLDSPMPVDLELSPTRTENAGPNPYWQPLMIQENALDKVTEISRSDPTDLWEATLKPFYTAKLWEIQTLEEGPASINIEFESGSRTGISGLFASGHESVRIYLLKGLKRSTPGKAYVTTLNSEDKKSTSLVLQPGDGLYILATNTESTGLDLRLRVSMPFLEIVRPFPRDEKGLAEELYSFSTIQSGIPEDAEFEWSFGDDTSIEGENASHRFSFAGSYIVKVIAKWANGQAENETEIEIKEPIALEIERPFSLDENGAPGTEYSFHLIKKGIPKDAQYEWTFGDGNAAGGDTAAHKFAIDGVYLVKVVATWPGGSAEDQTEISIQNIEWKWKFSTPFPGDRYCLGSVVPFRLAPEYSVPVNAKITWSFGDGETRTGGDDSNAGGLWADHKYAAAGDYTIEVQGIWPGGRAHGAIQIEIIPCKKDK